VEEKEANGNVHRFMCGALQKKKKGEGPKTHSRRKQVEVSPKNQEKIALGWEIGPSIHSCAKKKGKERKKKRKTQH